jgi:soluble lytic murein transglycosylase
VVLKALAAGLSLTIFTGVAAAAVPLPVPRPHMATVPLPRVAPLAVPLPLTMPPRLADDRSGRDATDHAPPEEIAAPPSEADADQVKSALARLKAGDLAGATAIREQLRNPAARALVEWLCIRYASRTVGFPRIAAFLRDYPAWPDTALVRRRAEEALYLENMPPAVIRSFFAGSAPTSALGRLAAARAAIAAGDIRKGANLARAAWREDDFGTDVERKAVAEFGRYFKAGDEISRAERLFYDDQVSDALRAAARAPAIYQAVAHARAAVQRHRNAAAALAAVPPAGQRFAGYQFAKITYLLEAKKFKEAAAVTLASTRDARQKVDLHSWWERRRWLARDLVDAGEPALAYRVAAGALTGSDADLADAAFHAGWIALSFLHDPGRALPHFQAIARVGSTPITRSRAFYWTGRALEAMGHRADARRAYARGAAYSTAYYGELAGARIGAAYIALHTPSGPSATARAAFSRRLGVRAINLLYDIGAGSEAVPLYIQISKQAKSADAFMLAAGLARRHHDTRALVMVAKAAIADGYRLEDSAWPTGGIPEFRALGNKVETAVVYAIARQESAFYPAAVSGAGARGLLQLMPATAKRTARAVGVRFDERRLTSDAAYNATLGSAHLGKLMARFGGSYVLTFAAYNAGAVRVDDWIRRYGDPRDPSVDPVNWVERIPYAETRNYVQRVMENVEIYRARLHGHGGCNILADLSRGAMPATQ